MLGYHHRTPALSELAVAGGPVIAITIAILAAALAAVGAITWRMTRKRAIAPRPGSPGSPAGDTRTAQPGNLAPYSNEAIDAAYSDCFRLAFGVARFDYQITGEHAAVLERVDEAVASSVHRHEYFPRRPMLLPRLLQALNDDEVSRQALVRLILEDPALAGSVLKRANSAFYRVSPEPVDSLDRAVIVLGTEGLRSLMAIAILQPVFRLPKGYFDSFAAITWEQAQRAAIAAETCARSGSACDPFAAQLLGVLGALARIVIFRLTMDMYRERPNLLPRAEVFIRSMRRHGAAVARLVASTWELSDPSLAALDEQTQRLSPAHMSALGRAVYFGELCGTLALAHSRDMRSADDRQALLARQGLPAETIEAMWRAAMSADDEA